MMAHQQYSYRPNMTRNVTRKWAEARQVDYGGDDWGDDPYTPDEEPVQKPLSYDRRAQTNPSAFNTFQPAPLDQSDERRNVYHASNTSSSAGFPAFDNAQPSNTAFSRDPSTFAPPSRQQTMPVHMQGFGRGTDSLTHNSTNTFARDNTTRPDSRGSNTASVRSRPRNTSLGQSNLPTHDDSAAAPAPNTSKPLPFVRPADIYKRMEEEKEKERRSQESSRPSMDSVQRDDHTAAASVLQPTVFDPDTSRRRQPTLDMVAERKSEYGLENKVDTSILQGIGSSSIQPIDTHVSQQSSIPSASSKYTDRLDPVSAATEGSQSPILNRDHQSRGIEPTPIVPPKDGPTTASTTSGTLQHQPSLGYKTLVRDAFEAGNPQRGSFVTSQDPLLRSNTVSTSEISPIVEHAEDQPWRQTSRQPLSTKQRLDEDLSAPKRIGTTRRESPSPARQPLSVASQDIPEPHSALLMDDSITTPVTKNTATQAQIIRPGPAILVHQQPRSKEYIHNQDPSLAPLARLSSQREQGSQASGSSEQRSASEEWQEWSAARREFNAKHGIKDSNPTTPGPEPMNTPPTAPSRDLPDSYAHGTHGARSQDINRPIIPTTSNILSSTQPHTQDDTPAIPTTTNMISAPPPNSSHNDGPVIPTTTKLIPSSRPTVAREESFRPSLPGGWQSSTDVPHTAEPTTSVLPPSTYASKPKPLGVSTGLSNRPIVANEMTRSDSLESVPTATAPRRENWRSDYTGPQAQAFANARSAGSALTGVFPTIHSASTTTADSEVSSINEPEEGTAGKDKGATSEARDFAAPSTEPTAVPKNSSTRDFAGPAVAAAGVLGSTTKGRDPIHTTSPLDTSVGSGPGTSTIVPARVPSLQNKHHSMVRDESPSKASDRWWSDEEDESHPTTKTTDVPAPLRTSRSIEPRANSRPSTSHGDPLNVSSHQQLESDIVRSLTPNTSIVYSSVAQGRGAQNDNIASPVNTDSRSPPFAAAALALSPSSGRRSLENQNTVSSVRSSRNADGLQQPDRNLVGNNSDAMDGSIKPALPTTGTHNNERTVAALGGPESQHASVAKPLAVGVAAGLAASAIHHRDSPRQDFTNESTTQSKPLPVEPMVTQKPPITISSSQKPQSPALARLNSAAKKEFTIMSDEPVTSPTTTRTSATPTSAHTLATSEEVLEKAVAAPEGSSVAKHLSGGAVTRQYPANATANAAVTIPSPTNKGSDLAPVHESAIEKVLGESTPLASSVIPEDREINAAAGAIQPAHESPISGTVAGESTLRPSTPTSKNAGTTSASTAISKGAAVLSASDSASMTPKPSKLAALAHPYDPNTAFPTDRVPSSQIVGMETAQQRIKAYNDNREAYIQPAGHLESWLSVMNTAEHADVFSGQRTPAINKPTSSPRTSSAYSGPSGSRQMQEDGRRLFEGAKRYGGKASFIGKGLFSKGKEKLRTASASNKDSRKTSTASGPSQHSSASGSAPQLPPPSTTTPIGEEIVSEFFASRQDGSTRGPVDSRATNQDVAQPPFTPISAVSTRDNNHIAQTYRPISGINQGQARVQPIGKSAGGLQTHVVPQPTTSVADKRKSAAAVSVLGSSHEGGRYSSDRLNPNGEEDRRNSSVSDVSSVSDSHLRRQSLAARTVSPPIEQQTHRNILPLALVPLAAAAATTAHPTSNNTKQAEAERERAEESTLPRYSQSAVQASHTASGAQAVPVASPVHDQMQKDDQQRPFSFVGNDSLLHSGERQHTIDSPDATARSTNRHSNIPVAAAGLAGAAAATGVAAKTDRSQTVNPLPSARRPPEEIVKFRETPAPFVSQEDEAGYRIPGPYTRELRSPKPKSHSPVKERSYIEYPQTSSPVADAAAAAGLASGVAAVGGRHEQGHVPHADSRQQQYEPQHQQLYLQQQINPVGLAQKPGNDRSRKGSRIGGFFSSKSRSPVRGQQQDRTRLESDNRRNSLFRLGSRTSISSRGEDGQINDDIAGQRSRPNAGQRRLSKDKFRSSTYSEHQPGQGNYGYTQDPLSAPPTKKNRFSGLFGRSSREQVPTRATTMPFPMDDSQGHSQEFYNRNQGGQQRYSTIGAGQESQGRQAPYAGYYDQRDGNYGPNQAYDLNNSQVGQMAHHDQRHDRDPSDQQRYYNPASGQRQQNTSNLHEPAAHGLRGVAEGAAIGASMGHAAHLSHHHHQQHSALDQYGSDQRPDLRLDTGERQSEFIPNSAPPVPHAHSQSRQGGTSQSTPVTAISGYQPASSQIPQTRANRDISYGSDFRSSADTPLNPYGEAVVANQGSLVTNIGPRAQALHMRSRSPKLGRPTSEDLTEEINALSSPATGNLGTFSNKNISPAGGMTRSPEEQEKPWTIGLPGEDDPVDRAQSDAAANSRAREIRRVMLEKASAGNGNNVVASDPNLTSARPQTVADRFVGHSMPASNASGKSPQTPVTTSTSTAAGKVPSPKASVSSFSINRNPSLRGKGASLSRSGTPVASNADLARTSAEHSRNISNGTPHSNNPDIPPIPTSRVDHLATSQAGEKNENYPASAIAALASQNRANAAGKKNEPLSVLTKFNEPAVSNTMIVQPSAAGSKKRSSGIPAGVLPDRENDKVSRGLAHGNIAKTESAYEARSSIANAPTPPPVEPRSVRRPPETSKSVEIHELVGSHPEGYESEDEPLMSATAYPGQEWQPVFERWED